MFDAHNGGTAARSIYQVAATSAGHGRGAMPAGNGKDNWKEGTNKSYWLNQVIMVREGTKWHQVMMVKTKKINFRHQFLLVLIIITDNWLINHDAPWITTQKLMINNSKAEKMMIDPIISKPWWTMINQDWQLKSWWLTTNEMANWRSLMTHKLINKFPPERKDLDRELKSESETK